MWSSVKGEILLQCIKNTGYEDKIKNQPETLEVSVNRLQQLFQDIRVLFGVNDLFLHSKSCEDCIIYDQSLYDTIKNYLTIPGTLLNYNIKPELTDNQLNTIKCVIETISRFMNNENFSFPEDIKRDIIIQLSKNFDIANNRFISYYETIFTELQDNLDDEVLVNPRRLQRIRDKIVALTPEIDTLLFTQLVIFVRSRIIESASK